MRINEKYMFVLNIYENISGFYSFNKNSIKNAFKILIELNLMLSRSLGHE